MTTLTKHTRHAAVSVTGRRKSYGDKVVLDGAGIIVAFSFALAWLSAARGLISTGAPLGDTAYLALAWCAAIALAGYLWSRAAFRRRTR